MTPILKNILAVIAGFVVGGFLNYQLAVEWGHKIIPPPDGVDLSNALGWKEALPLLTAKDFIFPFLGHSLGTLLGAFIATRIAATRKDIIAMLIGIVFLLMGIIASIIIPAPTWFKVTDLLLAYLPMAWLGWIFAGGNKS